MTRLIRFILRRDRVRLPVWIVSLVTLIGYSAVEVQSLYGAPAALAAYAKTVRRNAAFIVFAGPGYGFDHPTIGAVLVNETSLWMALGCGLMSVFLVTRHTRTEEDNERVDLIRSTVVGRHALLGAVLVVVAAANLLVALGSAVIIVATGFPATGAVALAASIGLVGVTFAAAAALAVQFGGTGRAAVGLGTLSIGVAFTVRAVGDVSLPALSWTTPFGWGIGVRAFVGERWLTLLGLAASAVAMAAIAFALSVRRDLGSGLIGQRPGPPGASSWITSPLGLTARLQLPSFVGWSIGMFATGLVFGVIAEDVDAMIADNPQLADYLTQLKGVSPVNAYLAMATGIDAMIIAGYVVSSALRARGEESGGRAEPILATPVSRSRWLLSHVAVTVVGATLVTVAAGLGEGVGYALSVSDASQLPRMVLAGLATLPALLLLGGIAFALFGWLPELNTIAWTGVAVVVVVGLFGTVLRLPHWARQFSPLEHGAQLPAEAFQIVPVLALVASTVGLLALGVIGFRRRDLTGA
jgi:ABC-2 type transport system permease protein